MQIVKDLCFLDNTASSMTKGRLAVVDIGSISMRLVVYDDVSGYPYMILNQKIWAALAENKGKGTFNLEQDKIERVLSALKWFLWTAKEAGCAQMIIIATSAVREAANGQDFVKLAEQDVFGKIHILSGESEAYLSAIGSMASIPDAKGAIIDLGGGSLELSDTKLKNLTSLPLGALTLKNLSGGDPNAAIEILKKEFKKIKWLSKLTGDQLVAIGSGMRSIARLHMEATNYPLEITHDYTFDAKEGADFCRKLIDGKLSINLDDMPKDYKDVLPYRAAALCAMLELPAIKQVRFATFGLREGILFSQMSSCPVLDDPLKAFAIEKAQRHGKGLKYAISLSDWCKDVLPNISERFIEVAAMFSETGWREQPLYRALSQFNHILGGAYVGAGHNLRVKLALTAFFCHEKNLTKDLALQVKPLISNSDMAECQALGSLFRLAQVLDPGAQGVLDRFSLVYDKSSQYILKAPTDFMAMESEEVTKLLKNVNNYINTYNNLNN